MHFVECYCALFFSKDLTLVLVLCEMNPIYTLLSYISKT